MSAFAVAAAALSSHERPPRMSFHARARMRERYGITLTDAEAAEIVALAGVEPYRWQSSSAKRATVMVRWRGRDLTIGIAPDTGDVVTVINWWQ